MIGRVYVYESRSIFGCSFGASGHLRKSVSLALLIVYGCQNLRQYCESRFLWPYFGETRICQDVVDILVFHDHPRVRLIL